MVSEGAQFVAGSSVWRPRRSRPVRPDAPDVRAPAIRVLLTISFHWPLSRSRTGVVALGNGEAIQVESVVSNCCHRAAQRARHPKLCDQRAGKCGDP